MPIVIMQEKNWRNAAASFTLNSGCSLNVTNSLVANSGSTLDANGLAFSTGMLIYNGRTLLDNGSMSLARFSNNSGAYFLVGQNDIATVTNAGEILLSGASAQLNGTGRLTNTGLIHGQGHIGKNVTNAAGGKLRVENGSAINFDAR
jgi:hypothetical protein